MRRLSPIAMALVVSASTSAWAERPDAYMCRNGLFPGDDQTIVLMRTVKPGARLLWDRDTRGCPAEIDSCGHEVVPPGQEVLAGKSRDGFICAFYPARHSGGGSAGWVVPSHLALEAKQPNPDPPLSAWAGTWRDGEDQIVIKVSGALLKGAGRARWQGLGDAHLGDFEAKAKPQRAAVTFTDSEDECAVTARLLGSYLIVADNMRCGAMNVRFDGVYRRKR